MSNDKEDVMVPENTLATPVFQKMRAIVEDPKNGLLQHYSRDFYVHDRNSLNLLATPEAELVAGANVLLDTVCALAGTRG